MSGTLRAAATIAVASGIAACQLNRKRPQHLPGLTGKYPLFYSKRGCSRVTPVRRFVMTGQRIARPKSRIARDCGAHVSQDTPARFLAATALSVRLLQVVD